MSEITPKEQELADQVAALEERVARADRLIHYHSVRIARMKTGRQLQDLSEEYGLQKEELDAMAAELKVSPVHVTD